jgi:hypothetical protein
MRTARNTTLCITAIFCVVVLATAQSKQLAGAASGLDQLKFLVGS